MKLRRIEYRDLNSKQKEIYNFQKAAALLADYGFNCIKLADDWQGADFLAYHKDGKQTLKVQLKGRVSIDKKYQNKDLWMCFRAGGKWYLVPHDKLVQIVGDTTSWLASPSWSRGAYSAPNPPRAMLNRLAQYALATDQNGRRASGGLNTGAADERGTRRDVRDLPKTISIRKSFIGRGKIRDFECYGVRYRVPHDELVRIVGEVTPWLKSNSWRVKGVCSTSSPSRALLDRLRPFALNHG